MSDFRKRLHQKRQREARQNLLSNAYDEKLKKMREIYGNLKQNMTKYSSEYESEIRNNKQIRAKFINICNKIGIDPIVSKRSMWGMLGDFYNQISIQILRICEKTKDLNGGLMKINELVSIFNRTYPNNQIDASDVIKAVENIEKLGNGCKIIKGGYISTVPFELSNDQVLLMGMSETTGYVSVSIAKKHGWTQDRFNLAIKKMLQEGLLWADRQAEDGVDRYYFPDL